MFKFIECLLGRKFMFLMIIGRLNLVVIKSVVIFKLN